MLSGYRRIPRRCAARFCLSDPLSGDPGAVRSVLPSLRSTRPPPSPCPPLRRTYRRGIRLKIRHHALWRACRTSGPGHQFEHRDQVACGSLHSPDASEHPSSPGCTGAFDGVLRYAGFLGDAVHGSPQLIVPVLGTMHSRLALCRRRQLRPVVPAPDGRLDRPGRDVDGSGSIVGRLAGWLGTLAQICARVGRLPGKHPLPRHRRELRLDLGASRIPAIPRAGPPPPRASWGILAQEILRRESRSGVSAPAGRDSPLLAHGLGHGADLDFFAHGALRNPRLRFGVLRERLLCGGRRRTGLPSFQPLLARAGAGGWSSSPHPTSAAPFDFVRPGQFQRSWPRCRW